jgi:hypothetical protein
MVDNKSQSQLLNLMTFGHKEGFYVGLMADNFPKVSSNVFSIVSTLFSLLAFYGIIWFERFGSDEKRTLINMLTSSVCWLAIENGFLTFLPSKTFLGSLSGLSLKSFALPRWP